MLAITPNSNRNKNDLANLANSSFPQLSFINRLYEITNYHGKLQVNFPQFYHVQKSLLGYSHQTHKVNKAFCNLLNKPQATISSAVPFEIEEINRKLVDWEVIPTGGFSWIETVLKDFSLERACTNEEIVKNLFGAARSFVLDFIIRPSIQLYVEDKKVNVDVNVIEFTDLLIVYKNWLLLNPKNLEDEIAYQSESPLFKTLEAAFLSQINWNFLLRDILNCNYSFTPLQQAQIKFLYDSTIETEPLQTVLSKKLIQLIIMLNQSLFKVFQEKITFWQTENEVPLGYPQSRLEFNFSKNFRSLTTLIHYDVKEKKQSLNIPGATVNEDLIIAQIKGQMVINEIDRPQVDIKLKRISAISFEGFCPLRYPLFVATQLKARTILFSEKDIKNNFNRWSKKIESKLGYFSKKAPLKHYVALKIAYFFSTTLCPTIRGFYRETTPVFDYEPKYGIDTAILTNFETKFGLKFKDLNVAGIFEQILVKLDK